VNIDTVNKWLTAFQSVAVIAAAVVAVWQLSEISRESKIQAQALQQAQQAASATLLLQLRDKLDADRYAAITKAIQEHDHSFPLLRDAGGRGKFRDLDIERYLSNFEDIGYLVREGLFSIAASVNLRPDDYMLSPSCAPAVTLHEALASLRGRRQAAS